MAASFASASSLEALLALAFGDPRLDLPLAAAAAQLMVPRTVQDVLVRCGLREGVTVGAFLKRRELHRFIHQVIKPAALLYAFRLWLEGKGAPVSRPVPPEPVRQEDVPPERLAALPGPRKVRTETRVVHPGALSLEVVEEGGWLSVRGEVEVGGQAVGWDKLLRAVASGQAWLEVSPELAARIDERVVAMLRPLAALPRSAGAVRVPRGALGLLEAMAGTGAVEPEVLAKFRDAAPVLVPTDLGVTLRSYQHEGVAWLLRLARVSPGACLADDMGLGKTVQALALLRARAALGPALVVAPASMVHAWRAEAGRVAPGLRVALAGEEDESPFDVLVVSWSGLARVATQRAETTWATVVLDEAQALKNSTTQRAKAAHGLQAAYTVALSGTPLENHAGELWSLFRALVPGLLGEEAAFRERLAAGPAALEGVAGVVRPFILRRVKSQVAPELPARTDIEVRVPLSREEASLYEAARREAVADVGTAPGSGQRMQVLAALTRLRLAACHPALVAEGWTGPASKLERALELLDEAREGGHRVLVFSQFTKVLDLVQAALEARGVKHGRLDGTVAQAERARRVAAFQAGEGGDVFLVSLRAGGTGLTLTAADTVLHLDPWWNPAVEDQASDRAHRIGQTMPVTVYRLVAEGTVEERVLALHAQKRALLDQVLEGTDASAGLPVEDLAALLG